MQKFILSLIFSLTTFISFGQNERIETDRPGKTNTACTTPNKFFQSEMGFQKQIIKDKFLNTKNYYFQAPSMLIKYGVINKLELRFISEFDINHERGANFDDIEKGIDNTQAGFKFNFLKQRGIIPKTSIIAHYRFNALSRVPGGGDSLNGGNIGLAIQHNISENFLLAYNIGVDKRSWQYSKRYFFSISPKFNFAENWQAFIEVYGNFWKRRFPETFIDSGISYYINNNFKVDLSGGVRISKDKYSSLKFYGIGASYRFKTKNEN